MGRSLLPAPENWGRAMTRLRTESSVAENKVGMGSGACSGDRPAPAANCVGDAGQVSVQWWRSQMRTREGCMLRSTTPASS